MKLLSSKHVSAEHGHFKADFCRGKMPTESTPKCPPALPNLDLGRSYRSTSKSSEEWMDQDKRLGRLSCCGPNDSQTIPNLNTNTQFGLMHPIRKNKNIFWNQPTRYSNVSRFSSILKLNLWHTRLTVPDPDQKRPRA